MADKKIIDLPSITSVASTNLFYTGNPSTGALSSIASSNLTKSLLPDQTGNTGKVLSTDGNNLSWQTSSGGSSITNTAIAYVDVSGNDSTGMINDPSKPFLTPDAALQAIPSTGGVVRIGIGSFPVWAGANMKSNVYFVGSGKPVYNNVFTVTASDFSGISFTNTFPTKLVGGTILLGGVEHIGTLNNVKFKDLGFDRGSDFVSGGGVEGNCLGLSMSVTGTETPPIVYNRGISIENCSFLGLSSSSAFHCIVFEDMYSPYVENVDTCGCLHGIALKCVGATVIGHNGQYHGYDAFVMRSNNYAPAQGINLIGFNYNNCGSGIALDASGNNTLLFNGSDGYIKDCTQGISTSSAEISVCNLNNIHVHNCTIGFLTSLLVASKIINCSANSCTTGFNCTAGNNGYLFIENCTARLNTGSGFKVAGSSASLPLLMKGNYSAGNGLGYEIGSNVYSDGTNISDRNTSDATGTFNNIQGTTTPFKAL